VLVRNLFYKLLKCKVMQINETIGIDVDKLNLVVRVHTTQLENVFGNNLNGFKQFDKWIKQEVKLPKENILIAFEHTGLYSLQLSVFLKEQQYLYAVLSGLELKKSLGIKRGKTDKIDAKNIALYAYRCKEEIKPYQLAEESLLKLKRLITLRDRLVKQRRGYKTSLKEIKKILTRAEDNVLFETYETMIKCLNKQINKVDEAMMQIINSDEELSRIYSLITSIRGVGFVTSALMIAVTDGFRRFHNSRKFATYSGIAPFPYQSGTSIKGKTKVSQLANKKLKSILSLCAISAIRYNRELKAFYLKKISEGKGKRSVINIIRNKIVARIFAVIRRGTPYVDIYKYAA